MGDSAIATLPYARNILVKEKDQSQFNGLLELRGVKSGSQNKKGQSQFKEVYLSRFNRDNEQVCNPKPGLDLILDFHNQIKVFYRL